MRLRVLVADADPAFRDRLKRLLGQAVGLAGETERGEDAARVAVEQEADVVLMDIGIPGLDAFAAIRRIKARAPEAKVILMTAHDEEAYLSATGKSGADAFLPKRSVASDLFSALRQVAPGFRAGLWRGPERRRRMAKPGEAGWDGAERRRARRAAERAGGGE